MWKKRQHEEERSKKRSKFTYEILKPDSNFRFSVAAAAAVGPFERRHGCLAWSRLIVLLVSEFFFFFGSSTYCELSAQAQTRPHGSNKLIMRFQTKKRLSLCFLSLLFLEWLNFWLKVFNHTCDFTVPLFFSFWLRRFLVFGTDFIRIGCVDKLLCAVIIVTK